MVRSVINCVFKATWYVIDKRRSALKVLSSIYVLTKCNVGRILNAAVCVVEWARGSVRLAAMLLRAYGEGI